MATLEQEGARLVEALCACWKRLDLPAIEHLWDSSDPKPTMLPQELERVLVGWEEVRLYWSKAAARLEAASMRATGLQTKLLSSDMGLLLYTMHWNGAITGMARPVGVNARVTAVVRKGADGWRFVHYVEAPLSFSLQLQQRNALQADPDFMKEHGIEPDVLRPIWPDGTLL